MEGENQIMRDIGETLPMHVPNAKNPIEVHLGNGDDVPSVVLDVASASDDENPDYNNAGRENQELEKKQQECEKNKRSRAIEIDRQNQQKMIDEQRAKNLEKRRQKEAAAAKKGGKRRSKRRSIRKRKSRTIKYI